MFLSDFQRRMRYMLFKAEAKRLIVKWAPAALVAIILLDVGTWEHFGLFLYYWMSAPFGGGGGGGF